MEYNSIHGYVSSHSRPVTIAFLHFQISKFFIFFYLNRNVNLVIHLYTSKKRKKEEIWNWFNEKFIEKCLWCNPFPNLVFTQQQTTTRCLLFVVWWWVHVCLALRAAMFDPAWAGGGRNTHTEKELELLCVHLCFTFQTVDIKRRPTVSVCDWHQSTKIPQPVGKSFLKEKRAASLS